MELNRTIEQWQNCVPRDMAKMSEAAIAYAIADARSDILKMHAALEEIRGYLVAASDGSMSRNNIEQLASELLERIDTEK